MLSSASAAPISARYGAKSGWFPDAPSREERAPPALVPFEMMRSGSPGMRPRFALRYRTAAL